LKKGKRGENEKRLVEGAFERKKCIEFVLEKNIRALRFEITSEKGVEK